MGTNNQRKAISNEAKEIYKRLVQGHMNRTRFGKLSKDGKLFCPNPLRKPWSQRIWKECRNGKGYYLHVPEKLQQKDIDLHLQPNQPRVYFKNASILENKTKVFLHPLVVDVDCASCYQEARELAAMVKLWLYDNGVHSPCLALPSTNGNGCHLWMMMKRQWSMEPDQFNELLGHIGNAMRAAIPDRVGATAHLCNAGNPIKASLTYEIPNPKFDSELAESYGFWRRAKPCDSFDDIVESAAEWEPVECRDEVKKYCDSRRVWKDKDGNFETFEGPIEQTRLQAYSRSKCCANFNFNIKLEQNMVKHGTLIAFPCAGRRDLVGQWVSWYDNAIQNPITPDQMNKLARQDPVVNVVHSEKMKTADQKPVNMQRHVCMQHVQDNLNRVSINQEVQQLRNLDLEKHEVACAAAQIALRQTQGNATEDDVLKIYEASGHATGDRTPKRVRRAAGALAFAKKSYDLSKSSGLSEANLLCRNLKPTFDEEDLKALQKYARIQWQAKYLNQMVKHRTIGYDQIAAQMAVMAKYSLTNDNGQISRDIVIKSVTKLGYSLHKDVYVAIKKLLIEAEWLELTHRKWVPGERAQCYAIGAVAPPMPWIDKFRSIRRDGFDVMNVSFTANVIEITTCQNVPDMDITIMAMPDQMNYWCVNDMINDSVTTQSHERQS